MKMIVIFAIQRGFQTQLARAKFMSSSVKNTHIDVYLVINEKNETHMVKLLKNSHTLFATKNCAQIMTVRLFKSKTIKHIW